MQNCEVAHSFFYDVNGSFDRRSMTVSYSHGKYFSYATCIGEITQNIEGRTVCIISDNNFSMTTAKHLNELRSACPYAVYYLPQYQGSSQFYRDDVIKHLTDNLDWYSKSKLTQKPNREGLSHTYNMLKRTLELEKFKDKFKEIKKVLKEYEKIYNAVNNPEELKKYKEIQAKREKAKQAKLKRELNKVLNTLPYLEILQNTYGYFGFESELKSKLKQYLNPKKELSFVWFDGEYCRTSQGITVQKEDVIRLLKLWQHNKLKHGMTISHYTVLEVMKNYVKIGCHKIPIENIQALLNSLPAKQVA